MENQIYEWTGFYIGGHVGLALGNSNWTANATTPGTPPVSGSLDMYRSPDAFYESGSWLIGVQGGYNYMLYNRVVLGVEADATFPTFQDLSGLSTGGIASFTSPTLGAVTYSETMLASGTVRARIGYAPSNWLFYATGGFAWTYNSQDLTQAGPGIDESRLLWRFGWAAGAGVEVPVAPSWTVKGEFLWTGFPTQTVSYPGSGQRISSDLSLEQFRLGLNYRFDDPTRPDAYAPSRFMPAMDIFAVHGQATFVNQAHPSFRSPYDGTNSLSGGGTSRETFDLVLSTGVKLWQGAEFWANPEIDQGFGFDNTHGVAGFPSAESYKLGSAYPYARLQRAFLRQTIDLGGDVENARQEEKVDDDFLQFAGTRSTDRLVFTVGRFGIVDIFDTNKYANNPKVDFLNWSMINAGTFDYAGDGWGYSYGAAAEWYTGRWTLRAGIFNLSNTPAGGNSPTGYALDPTFQQFELVGELEERHKLWGQPGKIRITGYLERGSMGEYSAAVALAQVTGTPADINAVRSYTSRPGVSLNVEQQVNDNFGLFFRAGWADGNKEPWDFTDIDRTVQGGVSINGKSWGRPDDTIGIAGIVNGISSAHIAFLNAGGIGILVGDGQLPNYGTERILEAYYSYAMTLSTRITFDYQFVDNPGYNSDRGPVNIFAARAHWQF
ncbi:carbohydrate porin [Bradyrhizobium genosp. P]|uniref:carbohydrate porin n=1 Tax=Bradyrhizobium genosp. P TaxID=83641 RepID=UPI003CE9F6F9